MTAGEDGDQQLVDRFALADHDAANLTAYLAAFLDQQPGPFRIVHLRQFRGSAHVVAFR
jgi:hypothetical protein